MMCKMMRRFQIWPQNSNRITYDPFFGKKTSNSSKVHTRFSQFSTVFWSIRGSNDIRFELWAIFGILSHFTYLRPQFDMIFTFWFFYFQCIFFFQITRAGNFFEIDIFEIRFGISAPKDIIMAGLEKEVQKWGGPGLQGAQGRGTPSQNGKAIGLDPLFF